MNNKVLLLALFAVPAIFMFFELQIIGHELYHFGKNSPYSTAICFDRDLNTNIVAYTVSDAGTDFKIIGPDNTASHGQSFVYRDVGEEEMADLVGYGLAFLVTTVFIMGFTFTLRKFY